MRNNTPIEILGLTEEKELASISLPYLKYFNDRDYIKNETEDEIILSIAKVEINLSITDQKEVYLPRKKLIFLDGEKALTLSYTTEDGSFIKRSYLLPFSTSLTLDKEITPDTIRIYPLHIYPYLYDEATVYIHTHYAIAVTFNDEIYNLADIKGLLDPDEESL